MRLLELAHRLRLRQLLAVPLGEREAARLHHPADEVVGLGERLGRRLAELRLDLLPLGHPLVLVESRFLHEHEVPRIRSPSNTGSRLARVKVLVVGSGAREHALAWRLAQSPALTELHAAPGNPGIASLGRCHPVRADDGDGLLSLALTVEADLAVIGPEAPLVAGVADLLRQNGVAVFGPSASAARIEGSKAFAKDVLRAAGVPTAETLVGRARAVRDQGGRPRIREGGVRLHHTGRGRRCAGRGRRRSARSS